MDVASDIERATQTRGRTWALANSPSIERATAAREPKAPKVGIQNQKIGGYKKLPPVICVFSPVEVTTYSELMDGIQQQIAALGIRYLDFDDLAGLSPGMTGKVLGQARVKGLGVAKLFDALRAAGLRIRLEVDPDQLEKMQRRIAENYKPRQAYQARSKNRNHVEIDDVLINRVLSQMSSSLDGIRRLNKVIEDAIAERARQASGSRRKVAA